MSPLQSLSTIKAYPFQKKNLVILSFRVAGFSLCLSLGVWEVILPLCAEWNNWSFGWFSKSSFTRSFPFCQEVLNIPQIAKASHGIWPPIFHPIQTAIIRLTFLLLLFVQLVLQFRWFLIYGAWKSDDSMIILHKICQIPMNCRCK